MRFRNVSPVGTLDVPLLGRVLQRGEVFDVPDDIGRRLLGQPNNYQQLDDDSEE